MKLLYIMWVDGEGYHHKEYIGNETEAYRRIAELNKMCDNLDCFGYELYEAKLKT